MASYPGLLYSSDDFALMTSGLAVIETTISVFNTSLFNQTKAVGQVCLPIVNICMSIHFTLHSVFIQLPTWVRAIVSNQLARDAREWCKIYSKYNSGTYNNQWFVNTIRSREGDRQEAIALCDLSPVYFLHLTKVLPGAANNACSPVHLTVFISGWLSITTNSLQTKKSQITESCMFSNKCRKSFTILLNPYISILKRQDCLCRFDMVPQEVLLFPFI